MADRPKGFGMTAELGRKISGKYDESLEGEARDWIDAVLGERVFGDTSLGQDNFHAALKDGVILCRLINEIKPGSVKKINSSKMAFKEMENIGNFLSACEAVGVNKQDLFQTVDLYEKQNMGQVVNGIHALGRKAHATGYSGPRLGPKEASANPRDFTEEQLNAGQGVLGLQMGSNKGASQSGQNFGKTRAIVD